MRYRNVNTGALVETDALVSGSSWEKMSDSKTEQSKEEKPKASKQSKGKSKEK